MTRLSFSPANVSATEFEEKVSKLVRFSNESGKHECILCFRQFSYRRSAVDHVKTRHLDRADHHCKFCPAVFKAGTHLANHVYQKHRELNKLAKVFSLESN